MLVIYADFSQLGTDKFIPEPKESYGVDFVRVAMVNIWLVTQEIMCWNLDLQYCNTEDGGTFKRWYLVGDG